MKIIVEFPPNYKQIKEALNPPETSIFCYGDTIYNPSNAKITPDLEVHEAVHQKQQGDKIDEWWNKYLADPVFRAEQELAAYGTQLFFVKHVKAPKKYLEKYEVMLAEKLSSEMYGKVYTFGEAKSKIRNFCKNLKIAKDSYPQS